MQTPPQTYTESQLTQYLDLISLPTRLPKSQCNTLAGLEYLNTLIPLHLSRIPFENLDLHYSTHHSISLDLSHLFNKIVASNSNRGGYCMELNSFFGAMLTALGYQVTSCGARVSSCASGGGEPETATYAGWSHSVNIVTINDTQYLVDVGFGANNPTSAIPLVDGHTGRKPWNQSPSSNSSTHDDYLLKHTSIRDTTSTQPLWIYHVSFGPSKPWMPMYCFTTTEFLPSDFAVMNYYVSHSLSSWFTVKVVCKRVILEEGVEVGDLTLFEDSVKERRRGRSKLLRELKSEGERVSALEEFFGIRLSESERLGIRGWVSMLR